MTSETTVILTQDIKAKIDGWLAKFPADQKQSAVLAALHIVQDHHEGWLSEACLREVAAYLDMPYIDLYGVATFYTMFNLEPVGKYLIQVCTNVSCMLCDSDKIVQRLKSRLGINFNETTGDGRFTLKEVECLGACANAPMMQINKDYYEDLTPEKVDTILAQLEGH